MKNILVTGANGHLGFTITKYLVERGYHVNAGVRNTDDKHKTKLLEPLPVKLVELDITKPEQVHSAMVDIDGIFHTAAVLSLSGSRNKIIDQTVQGAMNVVKAADSAKIKKIIYTSSSRVLGPVSTRETPLNENSWHADCHVPYFEAKIIAEKKITQYAKQHNMNVVYMLPSVILGPNINRFSESTALVRDIMLNTLPAIAPISFNFVDVRDAALAHILAYEKSSACGRYIVGNDPINLEALMDEINRYYPIKKPWLKLNKRFFIFISYILAFTSALTGKHPLTTSELAKEFTKGVRYFDLSKTTNELGLSLRSTQITIKDTIEYILENNLLPSAGKDPG